MEIKTLYEIRPNKKNLTYKESNLYYGSYGSRRNAMMIALHNTKCRSYKITTYEGISLGYSCYERGAIISEEIVSYSDLIKGTLFTLEEAYNGKI